MSDQGNRLIILPNKLPEALQNDGHVDEIMQFTGDKKVEKLLLDFLEKHKPTGPNYLVQRLMIPRNDTDKDCEAEIMDCSAFLMTRKKIVFLFVDCIATNRKQPIAERAQKTCQEIKNLTNILRGVFQPTVTPIFSCFICFDDTEENFPDDQRSDCFREIRKECSVATVHFVKYTRERISGSPLHQFLDTESIKEKIYQIIKEDGINETIDLNKLSLVVPNEKRLYFRNNVFGFRKDDGSVSKISLHNDDHLNCFYGHYFANFGSTLTTLPAFDSIKSTKLYPLTPGQDRLDDFKCPGLLPGPSIYVGEIEQFWPNFNSWFPNSKGLLMHSFSQKELLPVLQNRNIFSFEFDWLFWMEDKLIVFEVAMSKKPVGPKLEQLFTRHIPVVRTLFHFLNSSAATADVVRSMLEKCVIYVIFFAGLNHQELLGRIPGAVKSCKKYKSNSKILNNLYFVGMSNKNEEKFWKYDINKKSLIPCDIQPANITDEAKGLLKKTMTFFAMGYFTNKNDDIFQPFQQSPETLRVRYIDCQQRFLNKFLENSNEKTKDFLHKLDIILSPQQFGIILDDPKILLCPAEAGSGKTQLLLPKALQSAFDENIDDVYFCIPVPGNDENWKRNQLGKIVNDVVERNKNDFKTKFHLISDTDLKIFLSKPVENLHRSVLLVDEFQYNYEDAFGVQRSEFKNLALKTFPYFRNCWLANVTLHYHVNTSGYLYEFIPREMFIMRPLNVQYRSAKHISEFCSNLVQMNAKGQFSSSRVHGVFISETQPSVEVKSFPFNETSRADHVPLKDFGPNLVQSEKYKDDTLVVVICNSNEMGKWRNWIGAETDMKFVICCKDGIASCICSGGEFASVLLTIDGPADDVYQNSEWYNDIIRVICSRAQFELVIYVSNKMRGIYKRLVDCTIVSSDKEAAYNNSPHLRAIRKFQHSLECKNPDETELKNLLNELQKTPEQLTVWHDLKKLERFFEGSVNRQILLLMGLNLSSSILEMLFEVKNKDFQELLVHSLKTGRTDMLNWASELMEETGCTEPSNVEEILSFAAFKPKMLATIIKKLNQWLPSTFKKKLTLTIGGKSGSLLSVLCYTNANISDVEIWKFLENQFGKDNIFMGLNPLQHAMKHKNTDSIDALLQFEGVL